MTEDDHNDDTGSTRTFSQRDIDKAVAAGAYRERQRLQDKYADYDDLKKAAEDAGKSKTQLDRMSEQLAALTTRAEKAERDNARMSVAEELGLTPKEARRLRGSTPDEMRADGEEMIEDLGIDVEARRKGKTVEKSSDKPTDDDKGATDDAPRPRGRPREELRSGAPVNPGASEETDPMKLVAGIPRR